MRRNPRRASQAGVMVLALGLIWSSIAAAGMPILGAAEGYAVLGGSTVTNAGVSQVNGDIGLSPGSATMGLNTVILHGQTHVGDASATQAAADAAKAFTTLTATAPGVDLSGEDLGGLGAPLAPGTYNFASSAQLTGTLTLDFTGHVDTPFIFLIGSTLTTATDARVNVVGGGAGSQIYWLVGSSATLGTYTTFAGNILADASITVNTGASILCGRALAITAAVTLDSASVSDSCSGGGDLGSLRSDFGSRGFSGAVPEPTSWALMCLGIGSAGAGLRRRRNALANLA